MWMTAGRGSTWLNSFANIQGLQNDRQMAQSPDARYYLRIQGKIEGYRHSIDLPETSPAVAPTIYWKFFKNK